MATKTLQRGSILTIPDNELVGHPSNAYLDGYSDAKANGRTGAVLSAAYKREHIESYLQGFRRGLRVHAVMNKP